MFSIFIFSSTCYNKAPSFGSSRAHFLAPSQLQGLEIHVKFCIYYQFVHLLQYVGIIQDWQNVGVMAWIMLKECVYIESPTKIFLHI